MNTSKISILFLLNKASINRHNEAPIRCRITYKKQRKIFSIGLSILPEFWNSKQQIAKPPNKENNVINTQISLIKTQINQAFLFLQVNKEQFDVEDIYLRYRGEDVKEDKSVLTLFQEHNDKVEKLIGKEYVLPTLWKFKQARTLLKDFIKFKYNKNDYLFKDLDLSFIKNYEFYLTTEKNLAQSSTYKATQRFKKIIKIAISEGYLDKDPFMLYKVKRPKPKLVYLTPEELKKLEETNLVQQRLQQVKDMFIFCCYTGLTYTEMYNLCKHHILKGFDGQLWIEMQRQKTNSKIAIPLLPKSVNIIENYSVIGIQYVLPRISNQKFNSYLKEIAEIVGINKRLTHHMARRTFATTVLLYNDVPIEIVSELLGHSKITITQEHYAKVVRKKVSEHMNSLRIKLKKDGG